jgi:hypothetical protein
MLLQFRRRAPSATRLPSIALTVAWQADLVFAAVIWTYLPYLRVCE